MKDNQQTYDFLSRQPEDYPESIEEIRARTYYWPYVDEHGDTHITTTERPPFQYSYSISEQPVYRYPEPQKPVEHYRQGPEPPRDILAEGITHMSRQYVSLVVGFLAAFGFGWLIMTYTDINGTLRAFTALVFGFFVFRKFRALLYWTDTWGSD